MKFLALFSLISAVAATPLFHAPRASNATSKPFHLKTAEASNEEHNNLYVYAYHTGAALNDAVLTSDKETASTGFLNGTHVQFNLNNFPYGFQMFQENPYESWSRTSIDVGYGDDGFFINGTGLQWSETTFHGWLVCDWNHNAPQLFHINSYTQPKLPSSCSTVHLVTESTA
ncbi:hypothetical protein ASPWEDRAFT_30332 [Aspergillus wentii DTO 134E9]|uniref:DUF7907 domain-containing protein n=1 Tax=Aspergillus wentii DTO 134E9 TaxID=1073089 RepID=A0A1L9RE87_ASPWE|nr:uncharacterized protein ASPWEDRAFT_30332 [Aspergillus wentii DTO 134E9]KAI9933485.1 hypothetical protein MW887_007958 [Aspergillus wentii]OJJ33231.1 hypothetical protein ASPWEDRAFT_30332 [Aspergillus wentii DTO 134E9]